MTTMTTFPFDFSPVLTHPEDYNDIETLSALAEFPLVPEEVLTSLTASPHYRDIRLSLASNLSLPRTVALLMGERALRPLDTALLETLLSNPAIDGEVLSWALSSNYWAAPILVASSLAITPDLSYELFHSPLTPLEVVAVLAENPSIPDDLLNELLEHDSDVIRGEAAKNPRAPLVKVRHLMGDVSPITRAAAYEAYKARSTASLDESASLSSHC